MNDNSKEKILIEVASFCDEELLKTLKSALIQAKYPERIYIALCYQDDDLETLKELEKIPNIRIKHLTISESKGLCYARYLCQKMIEDEEYILQIDSHMRFVKSWDEELIKMLKSISDDKAIISTYPQSYGIEDRFKLELNDPFFDNPCYSSVLNALSFKDNSYFLNINPITISKEDNRVYKRNPFISGNYFFSYSKVHKEVYNDPNCYFYADELYMAIRLFTHGWNVYTPDVCYLYHYYDRPSRKFPPLNHLMEIEEKRLKNLVEVNTEEEKLDLENFGIGNERTIKDFEVFSGIDFKNRTLSDSILNGYYN